MKNSELRSFVMPHVLERVLAPCDGCIRGRGEWSTGQEGRQEVAVNVLGGDGDLAEAKVGAEGSLSPT